MEDNDLVEVLELTFLVAVPGQNGEPAKLQYTVRSHRGDVVTEQPGGVSIQFAPRELANGQRLAGKKVTLASAQLVGMEREVRLEPRVRLSAASLLDPNRASVEALKRKHGVAEEIVCPPSRPTDWVR